MRRSPTARSSACSGCDHGTLRELQAGRNGRAMMRSLLVANRGEIARRIMRTARRLGIRTVAVHSDVDAAAPFVREADVALCIGPAPARESYLVPDRIISA